jgi:hypothetical protein
MKLKIFFANFQILGPLGCQGWVVIPQNVKKVKITAPYWANTTGSDEYPEHTGQELMYSLSIHIRNWCEPWAYAVVSYVHAKHMHKNSKFEKGLQNILTMRVRNWCMHLACMSGTDACTRIHFRNWAPSAWAWEIKWCLAPPKIKASSLYFSPKVTKTERLYGVKILKIRAMENLPLGHPNHNPS